MTPTERIFALMNERKITAKELATSIGLSQGNVSDWKRGRVKPSYGAIVKIAKYFNVTPEYLLGETNAPGVKGIMTKNHVFIEGSPEYEAAGIYDDIRFSGNVQEAFASLSDREKALVIDFIKLLKEERSDVSQKQP